jgi:hypothetical protein
MLLPHGTEESPLPQQTVLRRQERAKLKFALSNIQLLTTPL